MRMTDFSPYFVRFGDVEHPLGKCTNELPIFVTGYCQWTTGPIDRLRHQAGLSQGAGSLFLGKFCWCLR